MPVGFFCMWPSIHYKSNSHIFFPIWPIILKKISWIQTSYDHSCPQSPQSFWSAPRNHDLWLVLIFGACAGFLSVCSLFKQPIQKFVLSAPARIQDSWCRPKGSRTLGTRMNNGQIDLISSQTGKKGQM